MKRTREEEIEVGARSPPHDHEGAMNEERDSDRPEDGMRVHRQGPDEVTYGERRNERRSDKENNGSRRKTEKKKSDPEFES